MSEQLTAEVKQLGSRLYEQLNHPRCAPLSLRDGCGDCRPSRQNGR